jgi:hypothetical protein
LKTLWGLGFQVWRDGDKNFVGHGGSCPGYRTQLLIQPEEGIATVFLTNAQGVPARRWTQNLYDIVAPAVKEAKKNPTGAKTPDASLRRYAGSYDDQPWSGETVVVPWGDGLAMLPLPSTNPMEDLLKLRKTGENTFRVVRKEDDSLGEEVVFEMGPDGRANRFTRHSNRYPRVN